MDLKSLLPNFDQQKHCVAYHTLGNCLGRELSVMLLRSRTARYDSLVVVRTLVIRG
jgi:hypothetical protein